MPWEGACRGISLPAVSGTAFDGPGHYYGGVLGGNTSVASAITIYDNDGAASGVVVDVISCATNAAGNYWSTSYSKARVFNNGLYVSIVNAGTGMVGSVWIATKG